MKFHSILSLHKDADSVSDEIVSCAANIEADLAVLFTSHHHEPDFDQLLSNINEGMSVRNLIGCTGESIIGTDHEIENQPAVVLWLASLPDVRVMPFLIDQEDLNNLETQESWIDRLGMKPEDNSNFVILADPFTFDILTCLQCMDQAYPQSPKVGGLASGANQPGQNRLFLNDQSLRQGLVGVALTGPLQLDSVVSHGCRPIGKPFVVTKAHANIIEELGGHTAYDVLKQVFMDVPEEDKNLMQDGVHVGVAVDEHLQEFRTRDFLVHNLLGIYDQDKLAISNLIRPGQTVQFHVRDAHTADSEMRTSLADKTSQLQHSPSGGLLFSCSGRGRRMFDSPDHDIGLVNTSFQNCQIAGFFAQGEIGPVGKQTCIHGHTSNLVLFSEPEST